MTDRPEFHLFLPQMRMSPTALVDRVQTAEAAGFVDDLNVAGYSGDVLIGGQADGPGLLADASSAAALNPKARVWAGRGSSDWIRILWPCAADAKQSSIPSVRLRCGWARRTS